MDGVELAPGLLCAAVGLALSFAPTGRVLVSGPAALLASALVAALAPLGSAFPESAPAAGCWLSIIAAAACVHFPDRLRSGAILAVCLVGGFWAGLVAAALGSAALLTATPWALLAVPGYILVRRGQGVAVKVMLSWLAAAAVLSLGLNMAPTLGYEPDHMD